MYGTACSEVRGRSVLSPSAHQQLEAVLTGELAAAAGASKSRCVRGAQGRPGRGALDQIFTLSGRRDVTVEQTLFVGLL